MCGIVGYLGPRSPKEVILSGLRQLEYRGYDSAGVSILDGTSFKLVRALGKLSFLEDKLKTEDFSGNIGIGHTRWATHGAPSERNAHPHKSQDVHLVHNGIIENYQELKDKLSAQGVTFDSDTDSEVVAHLLALQLEKDEDLFTAVKAIIPMLKGAYSILAVWAKQPGQMVAFKDGPPLVLGHGDKETIIASDIQAVVSYTKNVIYLEDLEICHLNNGDLKFYDSKGTPIKKKSIELDWNPENVEKKGFKHYMLKEIFEQPRALAAAIAPYIDTETHKISFNGVGFGQTNFENIDAKAFTDLDKEKLVSVKRVYIIACGTSFYAGMYAKYHMERLAKIPVEIDFASEFRYRDPVVEKDSLVVLISQSGETADTLAVLKQVKKFGAMSLSLCNTKRSSIDREADGHLYMNAGVEIGVASTKAFVCSLGILNLLGTYLAKVKGKITETEEAHKVRQILALPSLLEGVLAYDRFFATAAQTLKNYKGFLYLGRGTSFPIALEGALKLKELAYMHAEGYAAGEMKHGPLALIDDKMAVVVICPKDNYYDKTISNLEEAKARGGVIISIGSGEDEKLKRLSKHYLALPENIDWALNPILSVIPMQLMSYHVAESLGHDVDQPRNLAKSVTVE